MNEELAAAANRVSTEIKIVCLGSTPGYWGQESYRGRIFSAFEESYPHVTGDQLFETLHPVLRKREGSRDKLRILGEIREAWNEWKYAWDNHRMADS